MEAFTDSDDDNKNKNVNSQSRIEKPLQLKTLNAVVYSFAFGCLASIITLLVDTIINITVPFASKYNVKKIIL